MLDIKYDDIITFDNIYEAYLNTKKGGNTNKIEFIRFELDLYNNLNLIYTLLKNNSYNVSKFRTFKVYDPKERIIYSLPIIDKIIQHLIYKHIKDFFNNSFINTTYACIDKRGTHRANKDLFNFINSSNKNIELYGLKIDFYKFFASIDRDILFSNISKSINNKKLLNLIAKFIYHEDLVNGLPIGNLLSQIFGNIYLDSYDKFCLSNAPVGYFRYMDDSIIFFNTKKEAREMLYKIKKFINKKLKLKISKWSIVKSSDFSFIGKVYRNNNIYISNRLKRKIFKKLKNKNIEKSSLSSYRGIVSHTNNKYLFKQLNDKILEKGLI